ncbi:MAG: hypothetical protein ACR2P4_08640 [Gammaproteobacteria bacterium]
MAKSAFQHRQLDDKWYVVHDDKDDRREYAQFTLIANPYAPKPQGRQLQLHILPNIATEIIQEGNIGLLLQICRFVFKSALEITHERKGFSLCKMYSSELWQRELYRQFAAELDGGRYDVKWHRGWIEIAKKAPPKD